MIEALKKLFSTFLYSIKFLIFITELKSNHLLEHSIGRTREFLTFI